MPDISVIMPAYNEEKQIKDAVLSVLEQRDVNIEMIVINDGSKDNTLKILNELKNQYPNLIIIDQENTGYTKAILRGIEQARGEYLARLDADDLAMPGRFKVQKDFLDNNPEYGLIGSNYYITDAEHKVKRSSNLPLSDLDIKWELLFRNAFGHSSIMMRRTVYSEMGGYDFNYEPAEDYDLWSRIARKYKIANLPEYYLKYMHVGQGESTLRLEKCKSNHFRTALQNIQTLVPIIDLEVAQELLKKVGYFGDKAVAPKGQLIRVLSLIYSGFSKKYGLNITDNIKIFSRYIIELKKIIF